MSFLDIFAYTVVIRSKNVGKLISPRVLCTSVKNRVLKLVHKTRGDMSFPTFLLIQL